MPYIIAEPCINVKDRSCVDVCPVDGIGVAGYDRRRDPNLTQQGRRVGALALRVRSAGDSGHFLAQDHRGPSLPPIGTPVASHACPNTIDEVVAGGAYTSPLRPRR